MFPPAEGIIVISCQLDNLSRAAAKAVLDTSLAAEVDLEAGDVHYTKSFGALHALPPAPMPLATFDALMARECAPECLEDFRRHEAEARTGASSEQIASYRSLTQQGWRTLRVRRLRLGPTRLLRLDEDVSGEQILRSRFEAALAALRGVAYEWDPGTDEVERLGSLALMLSLDVPQRGDAATWRERIHPDDLRAAQAITDSAAKQQLPSIATEYRIRNAEGRWTWVWDHALLDYQPDGALQRVLGCSLNIDERKRAELALEQSQTRLGLALGAARMGAWETDVVRNEAYWSAELFELLGLEPHPNPIPIEAIDRYSHPEDRERLQAKFRAAVEDPTVTLYVDEGRALRADGSELLFETRGHILRDTAGRASIVTGVFADVTEARRARQQIQFLLQEINHRSKNLLSVVQAIANQATREDGPSFMPRFSQRLSALAACHDLLVHSQWAPVDLAELARAQFAPFADLIGRRITISGPRLQLVPAAAQAISLALHELSTNAGKYGALAGHHGRVDFGWRLEDERVLLCWLEQDGPTVEAPTRHGFGRRVMVQMVEMAIGGKVSLDYEPTGVRWRLDAPLKRLTGAAP